MTASVPLYHGLLLAGILFTTGLCGVLLRRNLLFILLSIEIMLNAAGLAFIVGGARWAEADGQILFVLILSLAAVEVSIGLALVLLIFRRLGTLDADALQRMRG